MIGPSKENTAFLGRERLLDLLPSLDEEELSAIVRLFGPVSSSVLAWCKSQRLSHRNVVAPVALVNIVQSPSLTVNELAVLSELALWVAEMDELFDTSYESESSLTVQIGEALSIASELRLASVGDKGRALSDLVSVLSGSPLWQKLQPIWTATLAQVFEGWMYERSLQKSLLSTSGWNSISVDSYLYFAQHTTALRWLWLSSVILENSAAILSHISSFLTYAGQCERVFRLADDLATRHRESATTDINSVFIQTGLLGRDSALSKDEAEAQAVTLIQQRLTQEMEKAQGLMMSAPQGDLARRLFRGLELGVEIYAKAEMRKWAALGAETHFAVLSGPQP